MLIGPGGDQQFSNFPTLQAAAVSAVADQKPLPVSVKDADSSVGRRKPKPNGSARNDEEPAKKSSVKKSKVAPSAQADLAEAAKYGKLEEIAFFDKVRKAVKSRQVYENFLRCLQIYSDEVASKHDLLQMAQPFLRPHPELFRQFKDIIGMLPQSGQKDVSVSSPVPLYAPGGRWGADPQVEVDYSTLKTIDESESYRVLPAHYPMPKCSGRTALCHEVLNDRYVSFPAWSESSSFVSAKKTQFEETVYRCEDERFELEMVIEVNRSAILCLESVQRKMAKMSSEDAANYRLDNTLGGSSEVIQQKAIQRLYGDRAPEIIDGLKRNPVVAVPIVLRRLKAKDEEWRDAQKNFNKIWREQMRKFYLKSLDHQGINFKQNDQRAMKHRALLNEIEDAFEASQNNDHDMMNRGPLMTLQYTDTQILDDATELIIYHVKRQSGLAKGSKRVIKQMLYHTLPDLFRMKRHDFSDCEDETDSNEDTAASDDDETVKKQKVSNRQIRAQARAAQKTVTESTNNDQQPMDVDDKSTSKTENNTEETPQNQENQNSTTKNEVVNSTEANGDDKNPENATANQEGENAGNHNNTMVQLEGPHLIPSGIDTRTSLLVGGNHWYTFLRLHNLLCSRLQLLKQVAQKAAETKPPTLNQDIENSAAGKLKYKSPPEYEPHQYYPVLLELVKHLLDCSIDPTQYEDQLRQMFSIHAYLGFTLDKLIQIIVKQLEKLVQDESFHPVMSAFQDMVRDGVAYGRIIEPFHRQLAEINYQRRIIRSLPNENVFK